MLLLREMVAVLSNKNLRRQLLQDALDDMEVFEQKYSNLKELVSIFTASKRVRVELVSAWNQKAA